MGCYAGGYDRQSHTLTYFPQSSSRSDESGPPQFSPSERFLSDAPLLGSCRTLGSQFIFFSTFCDPLSFCPLSTSRRPFLCLCFWRFPFRVFIVLIQRFFKKTGKSRSAVIFAIRFAVALFLSSGQCGLWWCYFFGCDFSLRWCFRLVFGFFFSRCVGFFSSSIDFSSLLSPSNV